MISALNEISSQGIFTIVLCVVLVLLLIVEGAKLWKGTLESLDLKSGRELRENALNERLDTLEHKIGNVESTFMNDQEKYHNQSIEIRNGLSNQITELNTMMSNFIDTSNQCTVASFRSSLWRMHRDFTSQGYITPDGLKTFLEMGKLYEFVGGDDIYHQILLPDIEALEIKYSKDSVL